MSKPNQRTTKRIAIWAAVLIVVSMVAYFVWPSPPPNFSNDSDRYIVLKDQLFGFIDHHGEIAIEPVYSEATKFVNGRAVVCENDDVFVIDASGNNVADLPDDLYGFNAPDEEGWVIARSHQGMAGAYDIQGNIQLEFRYLHLEPFHGGFAKANLNGKQMIIDRSGAPLDIPIANWTGDFSDGLAPVSDRESEVEGGENSSTGRYRYGYVDPSGKLTDLRGYATAKPFSEGFALVGIGEDAIWYDNIFIDRSGENSFGESYESASSFSEGLAAAKPKDAPHFGYINTKGRWRIRPRYVAARPFREGRAIVQMTPQGEYRPYGACIDDKGRVIFSQHDLPDRARLKAVFADFNAGLLAIRNYGYVDRQGELVHKVERTDAESVSMYDLAYDDSTFDYWVEDRDITEARHARELVSQLPRNRLVGLIRAGNLDSAMELLNEQPEIISQRYFGKPPLHFAVYHKHRSIIEALLAAGADVNEVSLPTGEGLITLCAKWNRTRKKNVDPAKSSIELLDPILSHADFDPNRRNPITGDTALHYMEELHPVIVSRLLAEGADPNARNRAGRTPLQTLIARWSLGRPIHPHDVSCIRIMLDAGADPQAESRSGRSLKEEVELYREWLRAKLGESQKEETSQLIEESLELLESPAEAAPSSPGDPSQQTFMTDPRDGETYATVQIGDQTWMAENLRFEVPGSMLNPDNPSIKYGRLYDGAAAQTACPEGWHLPTDQEWNDLEVHLGMPESGRTQTGWRGTHADSMKSASGWIEDGNGTNRSGLNIFPAGYSFSDEFGGLGISSGFWSSSEGASTVRFLAAPREGVNRFEDDKSENSAMSCRCVKD